ncbi:MAG TPA: hypothetical protein DEP36_05355 [Gammaproteobacteria bacterium]|nr:hypothetical protein [Gammaproteobacteria bacterium]
MVWLTNRNHRCGQSHVGRAGYGYKLAATYCFLWFVGCSVQGLVLHESAIVLMRVVRVRFSGIQRGA